MTRTADPQRREEILRAARYVFNKRGYTEARMAEIAERANIAAGTLYLYFDSKEGLVLALAEDFHRRLMEACAPALAHPDITVAIAESVRIALARSAEEQDLLRLLCLNIGLSDLAQKQRTTSHKTIDQTLAQALADRMEKGQIRSYDPVVLAEIIDGLIEWVSEACLIWGDGNMARYQETLAQLLQHALVPGETEHQSVSTSRRKPISKTTKRK